MFKSKMIIDMHLFGETLCQIMDEYEINVSEFAASMQMGTKYLSGVWKGDEVYNHAIYVRIVDGLEGYFSNKNDYLVVRNKLILASFGGWVFF